MTKLFKSMLLISIPVYLLQGYALHYSQSQFSFESVNGYTKIKSRGFTHEGEPGAPELPVAYLNYIIPASSKTDSLIVSTINTSQISGDYSIYPCQPPRRPFDSLEWVPPDTAIYNSDSLFPGEYMKIVDEGIMDGARIVTVAVFPMQYRPESMRLFLVTDITFEFVFASNVMPELRPQIRGEYEQAVYDAALRQVVENDNEIASYYQRPTLIEENELRDSAAIPTGPAIIITDSTFANSFRPYAEWLTDQGIPARIISQSTIYNYFDGRDQAEQIRNYIKYCYERGGVYFILGGDGGSPPKLSFRKGMPYNYPPPDTDTVNYYIPTDLYFADLTGEWNADNDSWWGERTQDSADRFPEVFVGRVLPFCSTEVVNWSEKALRYEQNPGNLSSLDTVTLTYHKTGYPGHGHWYLCDTSIFPAHIIHIVGDDIWADSALSYQNHGYGMTNVNTHGGTWMYCPRNKWTGGTLDTAFVFWRRGSPPTQYWAGLNWLTNVNKPYIHYSVACKNAYYDAGTDTCVTDAFLDAYRAQEEDSPVGACASISHTRWSWGPGYSIALQEEYYELLFSTYKEPPAPDTGFDRIGVAHALSKCQSTIHWTNGLGRFVCYATNLFGSPTTDAWTKTPDSMLVTHPPQIPVGIQVDFTVTVKSSTVPASSLRHAKVCLNKPGDIYEVASTNAAGQATFDIEPETIGAMKITVTRLHNIENDYKQYLPSQTTCEVIVDTFPPSASYLYSVTKSEDDAVLT